MSDALAPGFLIAFPHLLDPNFHQSVVLLLEHRAEGAMGVVVNRESPLLLGELCRDHEIPYGGDAERCVRRGGPVQPEQGLVLFGPEHATDDDDVVVEGLLASTSRDTLRRLCGQQHGRFQCYAGYAGWGPGQLENEISAGAWLVCPADAGIVLEAPPDEMWLRCLRQMGIDPATLVPGGGVSA